MADFIGRQEELRALQEKYDRNDFQMAIIYGRRRIGKTTMINRFIGQNDCPAISFIAVEQKESELLDMMGAAVMDALAPDLAGSISFESFEKLFDYIARAAGRKRIIFLIDEYPYLAKECPYMNSLLQKYIDTKWKNTGLFLILCGSLVSFMARDVIGRDAPLHGRSTLEIKLKPFNYCEAAKFVPDYTPEEKAVVYGLTGGVAKYLEQFNPDLDLRTNIVRQFFTGTGYFTEEQIRTIVTGDRLNPTAYNTILSAIASGCTKYSELAQNTKMDNLNYYLNVLIEAELVEKRVSGRKSCYVISDSMLRFWFRFVNRGSSLINAGRGEVYYDHNVECSLHEYMGGVFEEMARQYIFRHAGSEEFPVIVTDIEEYQNSVRMPDGTVRNIEIDLLGKDDSRIALIGECKFRNQNFSKSDLENFLDKLDYIPKARNARAVIFSLNGFSEYVLNNSDGLILIDIAKMYA